MHRKTALLAFVASALVASGVGPAAAQKQTLKMAYWAGPSHHMVQTQEAWAKTVLDASGGNLVIEIDKAPLAKPDGQYDIVKNGVRDLVWHVPGYTAGRFDLFQASEQPFLCPSSTVCSTVLWKWYNKHGLAAKEFTDTTLVTAFTTGPFSIHLAKPARTLEEIRALKIRVAGSSVPVAKALNWSVAVLQRPTPTRRCSAVWSTARCSRGRRSTASASTSSPSSISRSRAACSARPS
jgi:TRAP-type C4-dicarboxylate transport system substrate-binding protein